MPISELIPGASCNYQTNNNCQSPIVGNNNTNNIYFTAAEEQLQLAIKKMQSILGEMQLEK